MAAQYKLLVDQGSTWSFLVKTREKDGTYTDLTGYAARMTVRPSAESATVTASLTTENGGITLGGTAGTVDLLLTAVQTTALTAGNYVYDLELVNGAVVERILEGAFVVRREVTR